MRLPSWLRFGSDLSTAQHSVQLDVFADQWAAALVGLTSLSAEAARESISAFAGPLTTAGHVSSARGAADWNRESRSPNEIIMPVRIEFVRPMSGATALSKQTQLGPVDNSVSQAQALQAALLATMTGSPQQ